MFPVLIYSQDFGQRSEIVNIQYPAVTTTVNTESVLFSDNMNADNTVAGLQARSWIVLDEDGGGTTPTFYQGNSTVFTAYEGPDTGYVCANYNGANASGVINHWLISNPTS